MSPRIYRLVRLSCSPAAPVVEAEDAGGGGAVLRLVERVPPAEPVLDDDEDAVLAGDAAVGTRAPPHPPPIDAPVYWKKKTRDVTTYLLFQNQFNQYQPKEPSFWNQCSKNLFLMSSKVMYRHKSIPLHTCIL